MSSIHDNLSLKVCLYVSYNGLWDRRGKKILKILIGYVLVVQSPKYFHFKIKVILNVDYM